MGDIFKIYGLFCLEKSLKLLLVDIFSFFKPHIALL